MRLSRMRVKGKRGPADRISSLSNLTSVFVFPALVDGLSSGYVVSGQLLASARDPRSPMWPYPSVSNLDYFCLKKMKEDCFFFFKYRLLWPNITVSAFARPSPSPAESNGPRTEKIKGPLTATTNLSNSKINLFLVVLKRQNSCSYHIINPRWTKTCMTVLLYHKWQLNKGMFGSTS